MRITEHQIRQIIREELMLLTEQTVLSVYKQPMPVNNGTQIMIETQPPAQPPRFCGTSHHNQARDVKKAGCSCDYNCF